MKKFLTVVLLVILCSIVYSADYNYPNVTVRDVDGYPLGIDSNGKVSVLAVDAITSSSTTAKVTVYQAQTLITNAAGVSNAGTYAVSVDSITAISLRPALANRKGISIYNKGTESIYISTYAATSTSIMYMIDNGTSFSDNIEAYTGQWFGLAEAAAAAQDVRIIEKW